ncbi:GAF domain-containing protein [Streptomyces yaizuensis]|uniref:GAF domain-containing protein n=1 Tax=Streptomyces yaizuensis TaxID=2989713 RepID=A0ABQ5P6B9_9ACTN|nr:GAF domain-containing protein [Streptomyces sp. YSPA8]GLF98126.1 GAF domain-containing protein [Streptomyces sp. YSPA8]
MLFDPRTSLNQIRVMLAATPARMARLRALGLTEPAPAARTAFDAFAADVARRTGMLVSMLNLIGDEQHFVGLHAPTHTPDGRPFPAVGRTMSLDHGYCSLVVDRGKALTLPDVCVNPRLAFNEAANRIGVRSYVGAPVTEPGTGVILGTVCAIDIVARPIEDGRPLWLLMKEIAGQAQELVMDHTRPADPARLPPRPGHEPGQGEPGDGSGRHGGLLLLPPHHAPDGR